MGDRFNVTHGRTMDDDNPQPFARELLVGEDGSRTMVFANQYMCDQLLEGAPELHIDGTFKVVPNAAGMRQLVTIHVMHMARVSFIKS